MVDAVVVLQHHPLEHPGVLGGVLADSGTRVEVVRLFAGDRCPDRPAPGTGILVMGGPMGVHDVDRHPWLIPELAFLRHAVAADVPLLGICLGAQLVAAAAGAAVSRGPVPEVGWYRITPTDEARTDPVLATDQAFAALEWHRDVFSLPPGAVALARSAQYPVQAFRLGSRVYGLLFHLEIEPAMIDQWCTAFNDGRPLPAGDAPPDPDGANARARAMARRLFGPDST